MLGAGLGKGQKMKEITLEQALWLQVHKLLDPAPVHSVCSVPSRGNSRASMEFISERVMKMAKSAL